jgi:hypothetical protein
MPDRPYDLQALLNLMQRVKDHNGELAGWLEENHPDAIIFSSKGSWLRQMTY